MFTNYGIFVLRIAFGKMLKGMILNFCYDMSNG